MDKFEQELCGSDVVKGNLDGKSKLKTLCETRWCIRVNALATFKAASPVIVFCELTLLCHYWFTVIQCI
jgi:hypothetical protein